jgi:hypothetical protein
MVVADGAYKHGGVLRQPAHRVALRRAQYGATKYVLISAKPIILDGRFWREAGIRKSNDVAYSRNTRTTGNTSWSLAG